MVPFLIVCGMIIVIYLQFGTIESMVTDRIYSSQSNLRQFMLLSFLSLVSDVFLPIPSSFILYMNAYVLGILEGALLSYVSLMVSSVLAYYIGYIGAIRISQESRDIFKASSVPYLLIISRGIPILSESFCILCGYARYPFKKYMLYCALAYIPVVLIYSYFGQLANQANAFFTVLLFSFVLSFAFWLYAKRT